MQAPKARIILGVFGTFPLGSGRQGDGFSAVITLQPFTGSKELNELCPCYLSAAQEKRRRCPARRKGACINGDERRE
jgi:hypothetical protein